MASIEIKFDVVLMGQVKYFYDNKMQKMVM